MKVIINKLMLTKFPKVIFASDHAGYELKEYLMEFTKNCRFKWHCEDAGCYSKTAVDYPEFAHTVADKVATGAFDYGVLICGTGEGMCMTANKTVGIRAGIAWNVETAKAMREHNNANILCLGARHTTPTEAIDIFTTFLSTSVSSEPRHQRRINKIDK